MTSCRSETTTSRSGASAVERSLQSAAQAPSSARPERIDHRGVGLGTKIQLTAYTAEGWDPERVRSAFRTAIVEMKRLDRLLSSWRDDSDVARVNAAAGTAVVVSEETAHLVDRALWSARASGGAFDITFQSLAGVWKFGDAAEPTPRAPSGADVARLRTRVDYRRVELDLPGRRVKIGAGQQIGLGGLAKGYIVDRMARVLRDAGLGSFLVQAGGDLYAAGEKPNGEAWESGIQDPRAAAGTAFGKIELRDAAFSTAGDYARAFVVDGKRYHHIIDPKTGYPATASRSVTVWAPTALLADLVDDAVFVLGPEKGLELVESLDDVGAVIVDATNRLWISKRLRDRVKLSGLPTDGL